MVSTRAHPNNSGSSVMPQGNGNGRDAEVNSQNHGLEQEQVDQGVHVIEEQNVQTSGMPTSQVNASLPQSGGTTAIPHTTYTTPMTINYTAPPSTQIRATTDHFIHPTAYQTSTFPSYFPTSYQSQPTPFPQYTYPSFATSYMPQYTAYPSQAAYNSYTAPPPPFTTAAPTTETYQPYYSAPPPPQNQRYHPYRSQAETHAPPPPPLTGYPTTYPMAPGYNPHAPMPIGKEEQEDAQRYLNVKKSGIKHFDGKTAPTEADDWLRTVERNFGHMKLPVTKWANLASSLLTGTAQQWADMIEDTQGKIDDWEEFKEAFKDQFFPKVLRDEKAREFLFLRQGTMSVMDYQSRFHELGKYSPNTIATEATKVDKFMQGLNNQTMSRLVGKKPKTMKKLMEACLNIEIYNAKETKIVGQKRPFDASQGRRQGPQQNFKRAPALPPAPAAAPNPPCPKCGRPHTGECRVGSGACFQCGDTGHVVKDCPRKRQGYVPAAARPPSGKVRPKEPTRVFALDAELYESDEAVVTDWQDDTYGFDDSLDGADA